MFTKIPRTEVGDPTWEIATLFPSQGDWTANDYLALGTKRMVELNDGKLEFLPMPTELHQYIVLFLYRCLFLLDPNEQRGTTLLAPFRIRISPTKYREPDVIFMLRENRERRYENFWDGADLVIEVVSNDDPSRDHEFKRSEYAAAGVTEYWIVDPHKRVVHVLTLDSGSTSYSEAGRYIDGQTAKSILLSDFQVPVSDVFNQPSN